MFIIHLIENQINTVKPYLTTIMLAFTVLAASAQVKPATSKPIWLKPDSSKSLYTTTAAPKWKVASFTWVGMTDGFKPAMKVLPIDSNRRTYVHIDPKQLIWVNDSTFYIQHKP